ncbi:hypothetical protein G7Z17_g3660 [Cylindrodendrum hubeiense]|uniref:CBM-cenC domain-containing protein n=1 Tax=Cylindrodendrum hubeiense TaxID=595255 RepID=A0A9P5HAF3_9HYPO|nr:hypothetical protein G7Z17_g3660 [Cylindrodendrum hubeiense]
MVSARALTGLLAVLSFWEAAATPCKPSSSVTAELATTATPSVAESTFPVTTASTEAESTTEAASTTEATSTEAASTTETTSTAAAPTGVINGGFDTLDENGAYVLPWTLGSIGVQILDNAAVAHSGDHYLRFYQSTYYYRSYSHIINQTMTGLDTTKSYRLSYSWLFSSVPTKDSSTEFRDSTCRLESVIDEQIVSTQTLPAVVSTEWDTYSFEFDADVAGPLYALRMRCTQAYGGIGASVLIDDILVTAVESSGQ